MALLEDIRQDLKFAARQLRRQPAFSLTAILTLALGLGANTAIFSALHALNWRALPYPNSHRLAAVHRDGKPAAASQETLALWQRDARTLTASAGLSLRTWGLTTREGVAVVLSGMFTPGFFSVLGVEPAFGRPPEPGDHRVVWLTGKLWRQTFGGGLNVIGSVLKLNEESYTIAGVLPESFVFEATGRTPDLYFPLHAGYFATHAFVRLAPGVTPVQAQQELRALAAHSGDPASAALALRDLRTELHAGADRPYWILMAAVATLLLVACLNLASLLLARFTTRLRELAVRTSVGATRARLIRQFLTEATLLTGAGVIAAAFTAQVAMQWIDIQGLFRPQFDMRVLALLASLGFAVIALLTLAPALMLHRLDLHASMKPPRAGWRRGLLIAGQAAGSLTLLAVTALLLRSFTALSAVDPGFPTDGLLTAGIGIPEARYDTDAKMARFYEDVLARMAAIPGVTAAGGASAFPLISTNKTRLRLPGMSLPDEQFPVAHITLASPGFFSTTGIALHSGRTFDPRDSTGHPRVALVNKAFQREFNTAVGSKVQLSWWNPGNPRWSPWEIAGVVADVRSSKLDLAPEPHIYLPLNQFASEGLQLAVRTHAAGYRTVSEEMVRAVHAVDPLIQRIDPHPLNERIAGALAERRSTLRLIAAFALIALLLCAAGLFGLTAYSVRERTRELAIRRALGAGGRNVIWNAMRHGLGWSMAGVAAGLLLVNFATKAVEAQLYGVHAHDPLALAAAVLAMAVAVAAGCLVPARRAARVDPAGVLRHE